MYQIQVAERFSAAHNLRGYQGECEKLHGHNWKVEVFIKGKELDRLGLLIDFREVKRLVGRVVSKMDHKYLNEVPPFDKINPSSENIARFIFEKLAPTLENKSIRLEKVTVWESAEASATYSK